VIHFLLKIAWMQLSMSHSPQALAWGSAVAQTVLNRFNGLHVSIAVERAQGKPLKRFLNSTRTDPQAEAWGE